MAERWLRIQTTGKVDPLTSEGIHYTPLPYVMVFRMLRQIAPEPEDVFVDIGCGKGRVLCCASRLPMRKVVGIEQNPVLAREAQENVQRVRGARAPVELITGSAEDYDYASATLIYLYNPFNARITERVMERIFASWRAAPRRLQIVYANPVHESVLTNQSWLSKEGFWPASMFPGFGYEVAFWTAAKEPASTSALRASSPALPSSAHAERGS